MLTSITTAVAAFAVATNAFLIPSTMSAPATMDLHVTRVNTAVRCFDCPNSDGITFNNTRLAFSLTISDDDTALLANGVAIWSILEQPAAAEDAELTAEHSYMSFPPATGDEPDEPSLAYGWVDEAVPISYTLSERAIEAADGYEGELIIVDFKPTFIRGEPVNNIQSLTIRLLSDVHNVLHIVDVVRVEPDNKSSADVEATRPVIAAPQEPECTSLVCRIHALFSSSPSSPRPRIGCGGRRPAFAAGNEADKDTPPHPGLPHLRGGPPKFWTPVAGGGRPTWAHPASEVDAKPVKVDVNDGEDFHILPFEHDDEEHHGPPGWFRHGGERPSFVPGMPAWLSRPTEEESEDDHPHFHHHPHGPFGFGHGGWHHAEHDGHPPPPPFMSRIKCALAKFAYMVLLPMIVGIAAGCTISGVGYVISMGVVALYRGVFRKNKEDDVEEGDAEKKELLAETQQDEVEEEQLPVYAEKE